MINKISDPRLLMRKKISKNVIRFKRIRKKTIQLHPPNISFFIPTYFACCSVHSMIFSLLSSGRDSSFSCFSLSNCINWVTFFLLKLTVRFRRFKSNYIMDGRNGQRFHFPDQRIISLPDP